MLVETITNSADIAEVKTQHYDKIYVEVHMTSACNMSCYYCCFRNMKFSCSIDLNSLAVFLEDLHVMSKLDIIIELIGGEPVLVKGLLEFCQRISKSAGQHIKILMLSNFSADVSLYNDLIACNVDLDLTWHSKESDHLNKDFIDKAKMLIEPQTFYVMYENRFIESSLEAYKMLSAMFPVNTVLCTLSHDRRDFSIRSLNEKYTQNQIDEFYRLKFKENELRRKLSYNSKTNNVHVKLNAGNEYDTPVALISDRHFKHFICDAGLRYIWIDPTGKIYNCRNFMLNQKQAIATIYDDVNSIHFKNTLCPFEVCATMVKVSKKRVFR